MKEISIEKKRTKLSCIRRSRPVEKLAGKESQPENRSMAGYL
jgi:hypothetical protein